jgi:hypothetical protein
MPSKSFIGSATAVIARIGRVLSVPFGKRVADPATYTAHDPLWAGIDRKLEDAQFYLDEMARSLQPPERTPMTVVQQSTGAILAPAGRSHSTRMLTRFWPRPGVFQRLLSLASAQIAS